MARLVLDETEPQHRPACRRLCEPTRHVARYALTNGISRENLTVKMAAFVAVSRASNDIASRDGVVPRTVVNEPPARIGCRRSRARYEKNERVIQSGCVCRTVQLHVLDAR